MMKEHYDYRLRDDRKLVVIFIYQKGDIFQNGGWLTAV